MGLSNIAIVTDSTSDVTEEIAKQDDIFVVPLYIHYNGQEFKDGIDIQSGKIYEMQKEKKAIFKSSSPSPKDFIDVYKKLLKSYDTIISIHLSSKLSAVVKSAKIAADLLKAEERIIIFDSFSGTMGTGFMAIAAARAVKKGYNLQQVMNILLFLKENMKLYGTIDTLKYLRLSGRVPAIAWMATTLLRIKPLLGIKNGVVEMIGLTVTRWASLAFITRKVISHFRQERWVLVAVIHSLSAIEAKKVSKRLQAALNCVYSVIVDCTPVIGAHTGPGLIGIIISKLDRQTAELFI